MIAKHIFHLLFNGREIGTILIFVKQGVGGLEPYTQLLQSAKG